MLNNKSIDEEYLSYIHYMDNRNQPIYSNTIIDNDINIRSIYKITYTLGIWTEYAESLNLTCINEILSNNLFIINNIYTIDYKIFNFLIRNSIDNFIKLMINKLNINLNSNVSMKEKFKSITIKLSKFSTTRQYLDYIHNLFIHACDYVHSSKPENLSLIKTLKEIEYNSIEIIGDYSKNLYKFNKYISSLILVSCIEELSIINKNYLEFLYSYTCKDILTELRNHLV